MKYGPLEEQTVPGIRDYLIREIRRLTGMIAEAKRKEKLTGPEHAMIGIWLGEKFGYQSLLRKIKAKVKK